MYLYRESSHSDEAKGIRPNMMAKITIPKENMSIFAALS